MKNLAISMASMIFTAIISNNYVFASNQEQLIQLKEIIEIYSRFNDAIQLAGSTPRFLVNQRIIDLRNLRNEMTSIRTGGCATSVQNSAVQSMNFGIEGFERFANESSLSKDSSFSLFNAYNSRTMRELNDCIDESR